MATLQNCSAAEHRTVVSKRGHFLKSDSLARAAAALRTRTYRRPRDRHDVIPAREDPRERQLAGRRTLALRNLLHILQQLPVLLQVFSVEARCDGPVVARSDRARRVGEEAAAEGTVGDDADSELPAQDPDCVSNPSVGKPYEKTGRFDSKRRVFVSLRDQTFSQTLVACQF